MIAFKTTLLKFGKYGDKTGWTYIEIPADIAQKLKKGNKQMFKVKGKFDEFPIKAKSVFPRGDGTFIIPFNAKDRKGVGKKAGAMLKVSLELDKSVYKINKDLLICLNDAPEAKIHFKSLTGSHQRYFSKWIEEAKTTATKADRITRTILALSKGWGFPEMLRNKE